ncbi:LysR family transcriptional regulator [Methylovorus sp. MM2]|uniref:LysR family transcriptional regulator n=1 Tax=Methylovorus sp. MM2 TaxID=1848038 RepID=UPI0007E180D8|nr:LysR family transcriptional regulator [Methylovorus sp. MM2]OAM53010.1 LysR family transcriptional regulator [Methylovorus sp. MM2]
MLNKLEMIKIFCVAAEASSFKEAAIRIGVSPQAVTRAIQDLELALGELLFHRNTRQIRITEFGEKLVEQAKYAINSVEDIFQRLDQQVNEDISGTVRITAPINIGRRFMLPALKPVIEKYPQIKLDFRLADTITDVVDEKIDIGVRVGVLRDSSFVAKSTAKVLLNVVATPEFIKKNGTPKNIHELAEMPTIALLDASSGRPWSWHFSQGQQFIPRSPVFMTNDSETEIEAALAGIGYAQLPSCSALPFIRSGRLTSVLVEYQPDPWYLYVYRPQRGPVAARIRLVFDHLVDAFSNQEIFPAPT